MTSGEKKFLKTMTDGFKSLTAQLVAYKEAVELLRQDCPNEAARVDAVQTQLATSPEVQEILRKKFDAPLEKLFQADPQSLSDSEVSALLQTILQKRPPN
jgi:hypothetical protein